MRKYIIFPLLLLLAAACNESDEPVEADSEQFELTVVGVEFCNLVLIEFREEDLAAVTQITGTESLRYHALKLNKILVHPGQKLLVGVRKMNEQEWLVCPTFAPTYPGIVISSLQILP